MGPKAFYWLMLLIYAALWGCQMFVCNSTHSLIVLTDSYINLYYIIDIILELFYLRVQTRISKSGEPTYKLLSRRCTYQFRRLPLLGSFMNSVFLSALLMYAAIEGIQSCFHAHHLIYEGGKSLLLQHKLTYPSLLVGFAIVGILMRSSTGSIRRLRDDEIAKCDNIPKDASSVDKANSNRCSSSSEIDRRVVFQSQDGIALNPLPGSSAPTPSLGDGEATGIVLKSFKINREHDEKTGSICVPVEMVAVPEGTPVGTTRGVHQTVKHIISPLALIACAVVVYFVTDDLVTEVTDAVLAIVVVVVVYVSSFSSRKTLLQTAPESIDLKSLVIDLESVSRLISSVDELHVWSLTDNGGRVGTCNLMISKEKTRDDQEISAILRDARSKFRARGIECLCIQPIFVSATEEAANKNKDTQLKEDV